MSEGPSLRIKTIEPSAIRADPEHTGAVFVHGKHCIVVQRQRVGRVMLVTDQDALSFIELQEPCSPTAEIEPAMPIQTKRIEQRRAGGSLRIEAAVNGFAGMEVDLKQALFARRDPEL